MECRTATLEVSQISIYLLTQECPKHQGSDLFCKDNYYHWITIPDKHVAADKLTKLHTLP